jgi:cellulose 1,4-beta-cellobiosidase
MSVSLVLAALSLSAGVYAQQAGTLTAEVHPQMSISRCTAGGTCTVEQHTIVLDANWRWLHSTSGATNCYSVSHNTHLICCDH